MRNGKDIKLTSVLRCSILRMSVLLALLSFSFGAIAQSRATTYGTEFWAVFMSNYREPRGYNSLELSVSVAAKKPCTVTLEHYGTGGNVDWSDSFSVPADSVYKYIVSDSLAYVLDASYNGAPQNLRIVSTDTVTVYSANFLLASMDATNILPMEALGTEYILQTFTPLMPANYIPYHSMFAVTATESATTVTIVPSVPVVADTVRPQGVPIVRTLSRGQTLFMKSANMGVPGDLSGTRISSSNCKKIAVFQGNELTFVPNDTNGAGDHIYSQAMPVSTWGKEFIVTNTIIDIGLSRSTDVVRITASQNNTIVKKNGVPIDTLAAYETCEFRMPGTENSAYIETSNPSAVYMYMVGMEYGNNYALGDPSMVWVPPLNQTSDSLLFDPVLPADPMNQTFGSGVPIFYYINIVTKTADTGHVYMDSTRLSGWQTVNGDSAYSYLQDTLYPSIHLLHGAEVLAFVYGLGNVVSYAHFLASRPYVDMFIDSVSIKDTLNVKHYFNAGCPIEFASEVSFKHDSVVWDFGDGSRRMRGDTVSYAYLRGDEPFTARMFVYSSNTCERFVDSVVFFPIFIDTIRDTIHHRMCAGAAFDTNGHNGYLPVNRQNYPPYYLPGYYTQHLEDTASGCRHDLVIDLQVNDTLRDTIRHIMCVGQSFDTNGHLGYRPVGNQNYPPYSTAGSYTQYLRHPSTGCFLDLVVEIYLNDTIRDTIHRAICEGTTYDTLGHSYSTTGMYTILVSDSYHCLHNLVIDLWVKDTFHINRYDTICRGNTFTYNGLLNYRPNNPALHDTVILYRHTSRNGCDSIVYIRLHVNDTFRTSRNDTICRNTPFVYGNNLIVYTPNNVRVHDTTFAYRHYSVRGCDSTVVIRLHIKDTAHTDLRDTICRGDVFSYGNGLITYRPRNASLNDTLFIYRHQTAKGCDSNVYIRLHINDTFRTSRNESICRSNTFVYGNNLITYRPTNPLLTDTVLVYRHRSVRGCDSNVVIRLHITDTFSADRYEEICRGQVYNYGRLLSYRPTNPALHDTVIKYRHTSRNGCDSNVYIHLHINDTFRTVRHDTICRDAAFNYGVLFNYSPVNPVLHDTVIMYRHTTVRGCDSNVVIRLHIKDTAHTDLRDTICRGDVFRYGNGLITYRPRNASLHDTLFIYRHQTAKGCDSNVYIRLHINDTFRTSRNEGICRSNTFVYGNNLITYRPTNPLLTDTVFVYRHSSVRGCDSNVVIRLNITDTFSADRYEEICRGQVYNYGSLFSYTPTNPSLYDTVIKYRHTSRNGCDSNVYIHLHINDTFRTVRHDTICRDAAFTYGGLLNYRSANPVLHDTVILYRHTTVRGCDSNVVIRLHIKDTAYADMYDTICRGDVFRYGNGLITYRPGNVAMHDTLIIYRHQTAKGCDSNVYIRLHVNDTFRTTRRDTICRSDVFNYGGLFSYHSNNPALRDTVIIYTHQTVRGCDSNVVITLHINDTFRTFRNDTICRGNAFTYGGLLNYLPHSPVLHDTVIIYKHLLAGGCDSTVVIRLHVNDTFRTERRDTICRDAAFTYGGLLNYRSANPLLSDTVILYRHTTVRGCDSNVVIRLHIKDTAHTDLYDTICRGDVFRYGNGLITYRPRNISLHDTLFIYRHQTSLGCDSNVYIRLHVNDTFRTTRRDTICRSDVFTYGGLLNYSSPNPTLRDTVIIYNHQTVRGCDSNVVISLHINDTFRTERYDTICTGKQFIYQGVSHTVTENFVYRHQTVLGCDSNVAVHLWVKDTFADTVRRIICKGESFDTNGTQYTRTGIYRQTYSSADSCLSNLIIDLSVLDTTYIFIDTTICAGSVYIYNDTSYYLQGVYYQKVRRVANCDLVTINITVPDTLRDTIHHTICAGASFDTNGHLGCRPLSGVNYPPYTVQGVYTQYLRHPVDSCFHNLVIDLTVNDTLRDTIHQVICAGDRFDTNGHLGCSPVNGVNYPPYYRQGVYTQYLRHPVDSCFHNLVIDLTVNDTLRDTIHTVICAGDRFDTNGHLGCSPVSGVNYPPYYRQGVYTQYLRSADSCFHNLVIDLTVNDTLRDTIYPEICAGDRFDTNGHLGCSPVSGVDYPPYTVQGVYTQYLRAADSCFHNLVINLTVNDTFRDTVHPVLCKGMSYTDGNSTFDSTGVYTLNYFTRHGCDSVIVIDLVILDTVRDSVHRIVCSGVTFDTLGHSFYLDSVYRLVVPDTTPCGMHYLTIRLDVLDTLRDTINRTLLPGASFDTNGVRYYHQGSYIQRLRDSVSHCFHNFYINISVLDTLRDTVRPTICAGDSYDTNGRRYYIEDVYKQLNRDSATGVFSILMIYLKVNDTLRDTITRKVCAGVSFDTNGYQYFQQGQYIQHLRQPDSCFNNLVINITVTDTIRDTIERRVCAGASFDTNGVRYHHQGRYIQYLRQPDGCLNNLVIDVIVKDTIWDTIDRTVCAGVSFDTNGYRYSQAGQYLQHLRQPDSCYNNLVINITVTDTLRDTIERIVCAGASFDTNGERFHHRGRYIQYLRRPDGCLNNLVIDIVVNDTIWDTIDRTVCAGVSFDTNGFRYSQPGQYLQHLRQPDSCYNNLVINIAVSDTIRDTIERIVCAGASFDTNGERFHHQGRYIQHLRQPNGCLNNLVIDIVVNDTLRDTIDRMVCAGVSFDTNGRRYYQPGQYTQHLRQPDSCYNNLVINISVRDTLRDTMQALICAGSPFDTNGHLGSTPVSGVNYPPYFLPGVYTQHLRTPDSCYLNFVIELSIQDTLRDTIYRTVCAGVSFDTNGSRYYQPGQYIQHLRQPDSCYNNLVINISVLDTVRDTIYREVCAGVSFDTNGSRYYLPGQYTQHLRQPDSCYNNLVINISVRDTLRDTIYREVCAGASFDTNGQSFYFPGTFTQHLRQPDSCYNNLVIEMTVRDTIRDTIYPVICAGETFDTNGLSYAQRGVYTQHLRDPITRCYNNLVIILTVNDTFRDHIYDTVCAGMPTSHNGIYYYMPGTHLQHYYTVLGCDSIVAIHLYVRDTIRDTVYREVCAGASFDTNGVHYYFQGVYTQYLRDSVPGCFHNLVIDLTVRDTIRTHVYDTICEGTTYRFNSTYYTTTGVYRYMMKTPEGCDSITYLHLQVNPVTYVRVFDTSYTNVYYYHDSVYTHSGVYRHMLQREGTGCDSMVELHLWFCDSILTKVYDTICNDSTYRFGDDILTQSGVYYRVVPAHNRCDSIIELHLKVVDYPRVEIVDSGGYCINGYATLKVVTDGNRIVWSSFPPDSSLFGQEGNRTIYVSPLRHTIYTVEVDSVPRVRTCKSSASVGIHKASTVKAQMARDPMETTMEHLQTKFADISVGNVVYREWLFHETSPLAPDKRYEYDSIVWYSPLVESDSFRVRLAVRNDVGCTDTVVNMYPILKADLWVPNAFTPDENLNYLFKVGAYNLAEYEIYIYNRAGLLVFHSTDPDDSWDGTHKGKPCIPASYVYVINYKKKVHPKQPQKKVGSVLLIR